MAKFSWKDVFLVVAIDQGCIGRTLLAAQQTPGRALNPIRVPADEKVVQWFHYDFESNAAAEFPRAAAVGAQGMAFIEQRVIELLQLDWRILHIALAHRNCSRRSVFEGAAAPTATDNILADITSSGFRMGAKDRVTSHVAFVRRGDTLRQHRRKRQKDRVEHRRQ